MIRTPVGEAFAPPLSLQDRGPNAPREPAVPDLPQEHEGAAPTAAGRANRMRHFRPTFHPSRSLGAFAAFHPDPLKASASIEVRVPGPTTLPGAADSLDQAVLRSGVP